MGTNCGRDEALGLGGLPGPLRLGATDIAIAEVTSTAIWAWAWDLEREEREDEDAETMEIARAVAREFRTAGVGTGTGVAIWVVGFVDAGDCSELASASGGDGEWSKSN